MAAISPTVFTGPYMANGTQTAFSFDFSIISATDIMVEVDGTAVPALSYTVEFAATGGTVTFAAAPAANAQVLLLSAPDYLQTSEFENEGAYNLATINTINRRAAVKALVTEDKASRALKVPRGEEGLEIPLSDVASIFAVGENLLAGGDIPTVAGAIDDVATVAAGIADVGTVAGVAGQVAGVAAISGAVITVAAIDDEVADVAGISAAVTEVAGNGTNINAVAAIGANVVAVAGISANVTTVAGVAANVTTVATNVAGVSAVAADLALGAGSFILRAPQTAIDAVAAASTVTGNGRSLTLASQRAAPPAIQGQGLGRVTGTIAAAIGGTWIVTQATQRPAVECYLNSVSIECTTALVGRTVRIAIAADVGGGNYTPRWVSGALAAATAGVTMFAFDNDITRVMQPTDVIEVWTSSSANADGISYSAATGYSTLRSGGLPGTAPAVGVSTGSGYTSATNLQPHISFTTQSTSLLATLNWAGAAYGYLDLDGASRGQPENSFFGGAALRTPANSTISIESNEYVARPAAVDSTTTFVREATGSVATFANTTVSANIFYKGASPGFDKSGYLNSIRIDAGSNIPAACMLQIWVVRPATTPPAATSGSYAVSLVQPVGTFDLSSLGMQTSAAAINIKGLSIRVQAGDLLMFRGPSGFGFFFGSGTGYSDDYQSSVTLADTSISALDGGATVTGSGTNRRLLYSYRVIDAPYLANTDGPNALVRTDSTGVVAPATGTVAQFPLRGKRVAIVGSSISTYAGGGDATDIGHIPQGMAKLGAQQFNFAVGGSFVCWAPTATGTSVENQTIGATAAELTARFGAPYAQYSYENRLVGQGYDAIVMPDGMNDTNLAAFTVGTFTGSYGDPATLYGVFRRMIEAILAAEPGQRIFLQSPMHPWATYGGTGAPTEQANRRQWRDAMYDLADKYSLAGVLDYIKYAGCSSPVVAAGSGLFDTIHPKLLIKTTAGQRVVYETMRHG